MTVGEEMRLFFQTKTREAELIWREGFRDSEITEDDGCAGEKFIGVRLRDNPIGWNPNPNGSNLLLAIGHKAGEIAAPDHLPRPAGQTQRKVGAAPGPHRNQPAP